MYIGPYIRCEPQFTEVQVLDKHYCPKCNKFYTFYDVNDFPNYQYCSKCGTKCEVIFKTENKPLHKIWEVTNNILKNKMRSIFIENRFHFFFPNKETKYSYSYNEYGNSVHIIQNDIISPSGIDFDSQISQFKKQILLLEKEYSKVEYFYGVIKGT